MIGTHERCGSCLTASYRAEMIENQRGDMRLLRPWSLLLLFAVVVIVVFVFNIDYAPHGKRPVLAFSPGMSFEYSSPEEYHKVTLISIDLAANEVAFTFGCTQEEIALESGRWKQCKSFDKLLTVFSPVTQDANTGLMVSRKLDLMVGKRYDVHYASRRGIKFTNGILLQPVRDMELDQK